MKLEENKIPYITHFTEQQESLRKWYLLSWSA